MAHILKIRGDGDLRTQFNLSGSSSNKTLRVLAILPVSPSIPYFYSTEEMFGFYGSVAEFYEQARRVATPTSVSAYIEFANVNGVIRASLTRSRLQAVGSYYHTTSGRYFADILMKQGAVANVFGGSIVTVPRTQNPVKSGLGFMWRS